MSIPKMILRRDLYVYSGHNIDVVDDDTMLITTNDEGTFTILVISCIPEWQLAGYAEDENDTTALFATMFAITTTGKDAAIGWIDIPYRAMKEYNNACVR